VTNAYLKVSGKTPVVREEFITAVREGRRASRHSTRRGVGMGSRSQVFGDDLMMQSRTVASMTGWNIDRDDFVNGSVGGGG
jgi:hypothetical protein